MGITVNINYTIPDDLHRALKIRAAQEGKTLKQVILDALWAWIPKEEKR